MHERDVIERIFKKIKADPSGCWVVQGWNDGKGYQNISVGGKTCKVHRVMFEWFWRRKLRKNVQVDHKCVNRSCCNPLHLQSCLNKKNSRLRDKRKKRNGENERVVRRSARSSTSAIIQAEEQSGRMQAQEVHDPTSGSEQQLCYQQGNRSPDNNT